MIADLLLFFLVLGLLALSWFYGYCQGRIDEINKRDRGRCEPEKEPKC